MCNKNILYTEKDWICRGTCVNMCVDLLVVFPQAQQQLVVKTLEVLPQQRAQFNICLTLGEC